MGVPLGTGGRRRPREGEGCGEMSETRVETVAGLSSAGTKKMNSDELRRAKRPAEVAMEDKANVCAI